MLIIDHGACVRPSRGAAGFYLSLFEYVPRAKMWAALDASNPVVWGDWPWNRYLHQSIIYRGALYIHGGMSLYQGLTPLHIDPNNRPIPTLHEPPSHNRAAFQSSHVDTFSDAPMCPDRSCIDPLPQLTFS
jgi:hypothetical protein